MNRVYPKVYAWGLVLVFGAGVLAVLVGIDWGVGKGRDGGVFEAVSRTVNEGYGFREAGVRWNAELSLALGTRRQGDVVVGKDGWLFYAGGEDDRPLEDAMGLNVLGEVELEEWVDVYRERRRWVEAQGAAYLFVLVPNKHRVFGKYLPDEYAREADVTRMEQVSEALGKEAGVRVVDLTDALVAGKGGDGRFDVFGKNGTHWNAYGAGLGFNAIARELGDSFYPPGGFVYSAGDYELQRIGVDVDLARMVYGEADPIGWGPVPSAGMGATDWHLRMGKAWSIMETDGWVEIDFGNGKPGKALVFGDSFFVQLAPYFGELVGRVWYRRDHPTTEAVKAALAEKGPFDLVVEERVERYLWRLENGKGGE